MTDPIAKLHSPSGSLLSVFVNRRPPATRAAMVELLRSLRSSDLDNGIAKSIKIDGEKILERALHIESDSAPAVALFASHQDGIFEYLPLSHPVQDVATIGPRPYMRPLRAQPRPMRVGVLVADSSRARTYLMAGGDLHEYGDELVADRGKENYGGFAGYEEKHNRARAAEASSHMWRRAGRRLLEAHQDQPLELIVLVGYDQDFEAITGELHPYLRRLPQGRVPAERRKLSTVELHEHIRTEVEAERRRRESALLDRLLAEVAMDGSAVVGLARALQACNAHAVEHLVVSGPFSRPGIICDGCGWLGRTATQCPVCSGATFPLGDVVAAAMDATVEAGGRAEIVSVAGPLDAHGVGALLRFKLA